MTPRHRPSRVQEIFGHRSDWTPLAWLDLRHEHFSPTDAIWLCTRPLVLPSRVLRRFAVRCAQSDLQDEALHGGPPDPRLLAALEVVRRYAEDEATAAELAKAREMARGAHRDGHWNSVWEAAQDAAGAAAWGASRDASWNLARSHAQASQWALGWAHRAFEERQWQVAELRRLLVDYSRS